MLYLSINYDNVSNFVLKYDINGVGYFHPFSVGICYCGLHLVSMQKLFVQTSKWQASKVRLGKAEIISLWRLYPTSKYFCVSVEYICFFIVYICSLFVQKNGWWNWFQLACFIKYFRAQKTLINVLWKEKKSL